MERKLQFHNPNENPPPTHLNVTPSQAIFQKRTEEKHPKVARKLEFVTGTPTCLVFPLAVQHFPALQGNKPIKIQTKSRPNKNRSQTRTQNPECDRFKKNPPNDPKGDWERERARTQKR